MIDFSLKPAGQHAGGLNMTFSPSAYSTGPLPRGSVYVSEAAFAFLEPIIRSHSPQYARPYAHWGISIVTREEWRQIMTEWRETILLQSNTEPALRKLTEELSAWIEQSLSGEENITIGGI